MALIRLLKLDGGEEEADVALRAAPILFGFFLITVLFESIVLGGAKNFLAVFHLSLKPVPGYMGVFIHKRGNFFITFIVVGWMGLAAELIRVELPTVLLFQRVFSARTESSAVEAEGINLAKIIPTILFYYTCGFIFIPIYPILVLFVIVYLLMGLLIFRNQIVLYVQKYETFARFWRVVFHGTMASLVIANVVHWY